ncbi:MAG TPA: hypothetical protein VFS92_06060, partial [Planctomycetota bacterium]|nr:hypothetical protein [Planctomycetota bacterium]
RGCTMRGRTRFLFPAFLAAAALAPLAGADDSGSSDELASGDWEGKGDYTTTDGADPGESLPSLWKNVPSPEPGSYGGGGGDGDGGTPTPGGGGGTTDGGGGAAGEPDEWGGGGADPGSTPPGSPPFTPTPETEKCPAKWRWTVTHPDPELVEERGTLTLLLFRTDSWAFICSAYCRSESTWYADWFTGTAVSHEGGRSISIRLSLENACPDCRPQIRLNGMSQLLARSQVKARWGGVDAGTKADAATASVWAGPLDCSASCGASARPESAGTSVSAGGLGVEGEGTVNTGYSYAAVQGGAGDDTAVQQHEMTLKIADKAAIATDAGGTECNAQAKANAGYSLEINAAGSCGDTASLKVDIVER